MDIVDGKGLFGGAAMVVNGLGKYLPEPVARGVDFAASLVRAKSDGDVTVNLSPEYQALIEKQIEVQTQVQQATFASNIERANHETRMAPIRNMRVS